MKHVFLFLIFNTALAQAFCYQVSCPGMDIVVDLRSQKNLTDWDFYHFLNFYLSDLIKDAKDKEIPVSIFMPKKLDGWSPLDAHAPFIESIRTFLTWAKILYVLNNEKQWPLSLVAVPQERMSEKQASLVEALLKKQHLTRTYLDIQECIADIPEALQKVHSTIALEDYYYSPEAQEITALLAPFATPSDKLRFCVSGGAGFIGSWLVKTLLREGHQVLVLDNLLCSSLENLKDEINNPELIFIKHDVSVPFTILEPIDVVIHLASVPSPRDYYAMPIETLRAGVHGTKNLLELARIKNARFVFASTSEVYGDPLINPQVETYAGNVNYLGPRSQYDQSKRSGETLTKLYFERFKLDVRIARIFNTYGPGMRLHDGRVITNFIAAALEDKPLIMYGDGTQTRSFGYVEDTVQGLYLLTMSDFNEEQIEKRVFNIGTPVEFTIKDLALKMETVCEKYLHTIPHIMCVRNHDATDPKMRLPDITRAHKKLGFDPKISLDEGLEKTFLYFFDKAKSDSL